VGNLLLPIFYL